MFVCACVPTEAAVLYVISTLGLAQKRATQSGACIAQPPLRLAYTRQCSAGGLIRVIGSMYVSDMLLTCTSETAMWLRGSSRVIPSAPTPCAPSTTHAATPTAFTTFSTRAAHFCASSAAAAPDDPPPPASSSAVCWSSAVSLRSDWTICSRASCGPPVSASAETCDSRLVSWPRFAAVAETVSRVASSCLLLASSCALAASASSLSCSRTAST